MPYAFTLPPANLDVEGLRLWVQDEFQRLARLYSDDLLSSGADITQLQTDLDAAEAAITALQGQIAQADDLVTGSGSVASLTSTVVANIASASIPAGTWDVEAVAQFSGAGATTSTQAQLGFGTTSASFAGLTFPSLILERFNSTTDKIINLRSGVTRIVLGATTTYYLNASATFAVSTFGCSGILRAQRVIV